MVFSCYILSVRKFDLLTYFYVLSLLTLIFSEIYNSILCAIPLYMSGVGVGAANKSISLITTVKA